MPEWMNNQVLGITAGQYATAFGIVLVAYIAKKLFAYFFIKVMLPLTQKTKRELDDRFLSCVQKPSEFLIFLIGLFIAVEILQLPGEPFDVDGLATSILKALVIFDVAWFFFNLVDMVDHYLKNWAERTESSLDDHLAPLLRKSLRIFIVIMAALMAIQTFGYPVTGVIASLGIGGLAFALAAKDTVSNIFGSLMIIFDRPFHVGDWIKAGDMEGTVEEVGIFQLELNPMKLLTAGHVCYMIAGIKTVSDTRCGDTITLKEKSHKLIRENMESMPGHDVSGWLSFDPSTLTAKIVAEPTVDQVPFDVNMNLIIEFYR